MYVVPETGGECDGEGAGGKEKDGVEDESVVGQPATEGISVLAVGHSASAGELAIESKSPLSISDYETLCFIFGDGVNTD